MAEFPQELRDKLRAPLPEAAIKQHPTKKFMSSINPMYIIERLNDCFGENGWLAAYHIIENSPDSRMVVVKCVLTVSAQNIYRETFGGNDNPDRGDAYKGACTDALGKAASQLGIAQDVYKGMYDVPDEQEARKAKRETTEKRQYEVIKGMVTEFHRTSAKSLWLQVNGIAVRAVDEHAVRALAKAEGRQIEVKAYWDKTGKPARPCLTITQVIGVFQPVPGDTHYEPLGITDRDTAEFDAGQLKSPRIAF